MNDVNDVKKETELTPPAADLALPPWAQAGQVKREFVEALRRGDVKGLLDAFLGPGAAVDAGHRRMAEYLVEIKRRNIAVLGAADVFVRQTPSGSLQQVIAPVTLSLDDGSLYQIPDGYEKRLADGRLWQARGDGYYTLVPRIDHPETASVSAEGFLRMNAVAGCSVKSPPTIMVDGKRRENPYVERNEDGDTTRLMIGIAVAGPSPLTGNVVVVDYLLDLDPKADLLHMLSNIMKGKWKPRNETTERTEHDDDDDAQQAVVAAASTDAVFLISRSDFNEFRAEITDPKERRRWSWLKLTGGIGLAHDLRNPQVKAAYDKYVGILENLLKKGWTVARRNAMKAHPALARHRVHVGMWWKEEPTEQEPKRGRWVGNRSTTIAVVGWTAATGDIDVYARALDAVARGETSGIEIIQATSTYNAEADKTGDAELDATPPEETDEVSPVVVVDETQHRNQLLEVLDDAMTSPLITPSVAASLGYPPRSDVTVEQLEAMVAGAKRHLVAKARP